MDIVKVVGIASYDFVAPDGKQLSGYKYHCLQVPTRSDFLGYQTSILGASTQLVSQWSLLKDAFQPGLGSVCGVIYNRYGKLDSFVEIENTGDLFADIEGHLFSERVNGKT